MRLALSGDASDWPWCVILRNCSHASSSGHMGTCSVSGASGLGVAVTWSETAPTGALKPRKPPSSLLPCKHAEAAPL